MEEIIKHIQDYYDQRIKLYEKSSDYDRDILLDKFKTLRDELIKKIGEVKGVDDFTKCRVQDFYQREELIGKTSEEIERKLKLNKDEKYKNLPIEEKYKDLLKEKKYIDLEEQINIDEGFKNKLTKKGWDFLNNLMDTEDFINKSNKQPTLGSQCNPETFNTPNNKNLSLLVKENSNPTIKI
jgi:hypothetical protein